MSELYYEELIRRLERDLPQLGLCPCEHCETQREAIEAIRELRARIIAEACA
jgi:hypothetical protein